MAKEKAFDYMQVPLALVATDLISASMEVEGAYFRLARVLGVNGPMPIAEVRDLIGDQPRIERLLDHRSTDAEPLLSFGWVEEWRSRAKASRERLSAAGKVSAEKRAKKKTRRNISSTQVEQQPNSSSTSVEHATILSSTIISESSGKKERATDERFEALWIAYERHGAKSKAAAYWAKLPEVDRLAIEAKVAAYVASTPGCQYRMNLEGWINPAERRWERPIRVPAPTHRDTAPTTAPMRRDAPIERDMITRRPT